MQTRLLNLILSVFVDERWRMTYIDVAILNLTESLCRIFQRLTGRTNVWLAVQLTNLSIIVYFVWAGLQFLSADVPSRVALGLFCGTLLVVLTQTILKVPIETHEKSAYRRVANGQRNPRRLRDAPLRIPFLTLSIGFLFPIVVFYGNLVAANLREIALLGYSLVLLTTIVLYVLACDPLPPQTGSKVRVWLRGTTPSRAAVPESPGDSSRRINS